MLEGIIRETIRMGGHTNVAVCQVDGNVNAVTINSTNHEAVDEAVAFLISITEGDAEKIREVNADNGLRFVTVEFV